MKLTNKSMPRKLLRDGGKKVPEPHNVSEYKLQNYSRLHRLASQKRACYKVRHDAKENYITLSVRGSPLLTEFLPSPRIVAGQQMKAAATSPSQHSYRYAK